jgi:uncharacterized protein (DUF488 family)
VKRLFTIGYERAAISDLVATLREVGVEALIDVRDLPVSRKRGFSKRALAQRLEEVGIRYMHMRDLGDPKPGREAARRGDFEQFEAIFRDHLNRRESQHALRCAVEVACKYVSCLLCFERAHECCHRAIVAEAMRVRQGFDVEHIGVHKALGIAGCRDPQFRECAVG